MEKFTNYKCVNGHDYCWTSYPGPECPYCEVSEIERYIDPEFGMTWASEEHYQEYLAIKAGMEFQKLGMAVIPLKEYERLKLAENLLYEMEPEWLINEMRESNK